MTHIFCKRVTPKLGIGRRLSIFAFASIGLAATSASAQGNAALRIFSSENSSHALTANVSSGLNGHTNDIDDQATSASAKPIEFDVVSVKPDKTGNGRMMFMNGLEAFGGTNIPLMLLLKSAYGMNEDQILGAPGWVSSDRFDIEAKVAGSDVAELKKLNDDQQDAAQEHMLQTLLAERFALKAHKETKELPIYELVVAKRGSKLKQATAGDTYANGIKGPDGTSHPGMMRMGPGNFSGQAVSLSTLVDILAQRTHRRVVDKTGLTGSFDIALNWTSDDGPGGIAKAADNGSGDTPPDIFTALQEQLGLRLQPAKGPVETLVVDHIEQPSAN